MSTDEPEEHEEPEEIQSMHTLARCTDFIANEFDINMGAASTIMRNLVPRLRPPTNPNNQLTRRETCNRIIQFLQRNPDIIVAVNDIADMYIMIDSDDTLTPQQKVQIRFNIVNITMMVYQMLNQRLI